MKIKHEIIYDRIEKSHFFYFSIILNYVCKEFNFLKRMTKAKKGINLH